MSKCIEYECLIYDNKKVTINDSYYTFSRFESKILEELKKDYYFDFERNESGSVIKIFDNNGTNDLVAMYIIDFVNRKARDNFNNNIFSITDGTFRLCNFFGKIKFRCNEINYSLFYDGYSGYEFKKLREELIQFVVYDDGCINNRDYGLIDFDFIYNKVLDDADMRYYPLVDENEHFVVMKYKTNNNTIKRLIFPFLESYSYLRYLKMDYNYNLGTKELYSFLVKIKQKYGACLINNDGSVIFGGETLNFQTFEDMLLKDICFKNGFKLDYNSNNILLSYTSRKYNNPKKLVIDFMDRKAYYNYVFENFYNYNQATYNVYKLLTIVRGNFNQIVNKSVDVLEKRIYLDYLSDSKKYLKDNENRNFLNEFMITFKSVGLVSLVILFILSIMTGMSALIFGGIFSIIDFYLSFVINASVLKDNKMILEDRKFKINALTKDLEGSQEFLEVKDKQQICDFTNQKANGSNKSYKFNNKILEDIHNLLDKISGLNQEKRDTLLFRVETLLSDYEKRVKDIEENKDVVFYPDDYYRLKQDVYEEIGKIEFEIEKFSKEQEINAKLTKDLSQLECEIDVLLDKKGKSSMDNLSRKKDKNYDFNNGTLKDIHNLLIKISTLNQDLRNTLVLRVKNLLSDYENRVKDIEKNKDVVFYYDNYDKLKDDVYIEIGKIEFEIEKLSKDQNIRDKLNEDLGQLRNEMEFLQDKESKSLMDSVSFSDSYKETDNIDGDNIIFDDVEYDLTSVYDRKKLLEVLLKNDYIIGNIEKADVDVDFFKMIVSLANNKFFKFDVSNQFRESKVLKELRSEFDKKETKPHTKTKKL